MDFVIRLLVAAASFLTAQPSPTPDPIRDLLRIENLVFTTPISDFVRLVTSHSLEDSWFDWTSDGCSAPLVGNKGLSFDFTRPCLRHDFAYRNYKLLDSRYSCANRPAESVCNAPDVRPGVFWNSSTRQKIDRKFKVDLLYECANRGVTERFRCRAWAEVFYRAVRIAGGP